MGIGTIAIFNTVSYWQFLFCGKLSILGFSVHVTLWVAAFRALDGKFRL